MSTGSFSDLTFSKGSIICKPTGVPIDPIFPERFASSRSVGDPGSLNSIVDEGVDDSDNSRCGERSAGGSAVSALSRSSVGIASCGSKPMSVGGSFVPRAPGFSRSTSIGGSSLSG